LRPAAISARRDSCVLEGALRIHNSRHSLAMELYAQSDMDSMRDAQGKFLQQLMGDRIHLLTERVQ
jgi:integrase